LFWLGVLGFTLWFSVPRIAAPIMASNGYRRVEALREPILAAALEFDLDPHFLAGIALAESSGRVDVVSRAGALGLFQLMLPTAREQARELGLPEPSRSDLLSRADLSARLAARYVRWLSDRYADDGEMVLVAYNAGPGRLDGWIAEHGSYDAWRERRASDSEVLGYARKVRRYSDEFVERGLFAPRARDAQPMEAARAQRP
jgi:soluble lytic murein transglycosylase